MTAARKKAAVSPEPAAIVTIAEGKLDKLAEEINDRWHALRRADTEERIAVGRMLLVAKQQVEKSGPDWVKVSWEKWCARNIERSMSDINKVMALATAPDPLAALEKERADRRKAMAELKAKRAQAAAIKEDAQLGANDAEGDPEEQQHDERTPAPTSGVTEIRLPDDAFSAIPLDRLCFASFREEIVGAKRVAIISVPGTVDEGVQVAVIQHLCSVALPGTRTQIRQLVERGDFAAAAPEVATDSAA